MFSSHNWKKEVVFPVYALANVNRDYCMPICSCKYKLLFATHLKYPFFPALPESYVAAGEQSRKIMDSLPVELRHNLAVMMNQGIFSKV